MSLFLWNLGQGRLGHEIVVLEGFAEGTLSVGTSLSSSRWSLPAEGLDQAFVGAPKDFSGTMEVAASSTPPTMNRRKRR